MSSSLPDKTPGIPNPDDLSLLLEFTLSLRGGQRQMFSGRWDRAWTLQAAFIHMCEGFSVSCKREDTKRREPAKKLLVLLAWAPHVLAQVYS